MKYRAEIDGLRALAVLPVILFHAGFEWFSGGFVGVDVFFVISGYLITTIIISEMAEGKFSIVNFYERRARRILPALFFVIIASFPLFYFSYYGNYFTEYVKSIAATATFTSNIFFWLNSNYFSLGSEIKPLLHTWSLAVEEQYYILFPIFLMFTWRLGIKWVLILLSIVFFISLGVAQLGAYNSPNAAFFLLPTRGWELLVGVFAAFYLKHNMYLKSLFLNQILSLLGLGMIVYSIIAFDESTPFPSLYALIPTIGTGLIILSSTKQTVVHSLLGSKVLVGLGLISYSAYLWHQPLLAALAFNMPFEERYFYKILVILITLALAYLSYKFIEGPFRNKYQISKQNIFIFAIVGSISLTLFGVVMSDKKDHNNNYSVKFNQKGYIFDNAKLLEDSWNILGDKLGIYYPMYSVSNNNIDNELWFDLSDSRPKVLLVGNSHSKDFYNVLYYSDDAKENVQLARYGTQISKISSAFFNSPNYKNADIVLLVSAMTKEDIDGIEDVIANISEDGKKVILFKTIFRAFERSYVTGIDRLIVQNIEYEDGYLRVNSTYTELYSANIFLNEEVLQNALSEEALFKKLSNIYDFQIMDRMDYVCYPKLCNLVDQNYSKLFYDSGHHTLRGAKVFGEVVDELDWVEKIISQN
jgi:peptidoglycan/LPS O-acetylase OafA/YrhL|tara:strand:+ start:57 stop:1985 length:1929 start_codon:yes stop_codon:yes gene_type:complete